MELHYANNMPKHKTLLETLHYIPVGQRITNAIVTMALLMFVNHLKQFLDVFLVTLINKKTVVAATVFYEYNERIINK